MRQNKRFILTALLALVAIMALCFTLAACNAKEYSVNLQFNEAQGNVELSPATENGKYKEGTELTVTVTPKTGYALDTFKLSTEDRASTPNNEGKFVFKVKEDTTIAVTFKSTTPEPVADKFTLTVPANVDNGTVKVEPASADNKYDDGTEITVTLTPAQGYEVATFTVGGVDKKAELKDGVYKFNITADTAIAASFSKVIEKFTLTVPASVDNGTVKVEPASADNKYDDGTEITVTLTPAQGYEVATFTVGGVDKKAELKDGVYKFNITADTAIAASFSKVIEKFTLTVPASVDNGTVKVEPASADNKYDDGTEITVTLTPAQGYEVATFTVGGVDKKAELKDGVYKFNITADTAIAATFNAQQFTVTTTVTGESEQGSIALSPEPTEGKYAYGTRVTVTVTAKSGYGITPNSFKVSTDLDAELVDGEYTFTVTADTTISVVIHQHEYSEYEVVDGTPTEHEAYCDVCDYHLRENHSQYYIVSEKTAEGETITCSKGCGYTRSGQHNLQWVNDGDGNCHQECTNLYPKCDYKTESKLHDMKWQRLDPVSEGHSGVCNNCGYSVDKEEHDTLGEGGACSKCGYKDAGGHTCKDDPENGYYDGLCDICGKIFNDTWTFEAGTIVKYNGNYAKVRIPAEINGTPVTTFKGGSQSDGCFVNNTMITDIIIPESISSLPTYGFFGCSNLSTVIILAQVDTLSQNLFAKCTSLSWLVLPATLTTINNFAFGMMATQVTKVLEKVYFMGEQSAWETLVNGLGGQSKTLLTNKTTLFYSDAETGSDAQWHWDTDGVTPKPGPWGA